MIEKWEENAVDNATWGKNTQSVSKHVEESQAKLKRLKGKEVP